MLDLFHLGAGLGDIGHGGQLYDIYRSQLGMCGRLHLDLVASFLQVLLHLLGILLFFERPHLHGIGSPLLLGRRRLGRGRRIIRAR